MKDQKIKSGRSRFGWWILLLALVAINIIAVFFHQRIDLTSEKRYTLSQPTRNLLLSLDAPARIDVFLKGEFPAGFKKLANSVQEFLQECQEYAGGNLEIRYLEPFKGLDDSAAAYLADSLQYFYGLQASTLQAPGKVGDAISFKQVIPGALIHYKDTTVGVNLLKGVRSYGTEPEQLAALYNDVEATLEYKFASALQKATAERKPLVGYVVGNGESWGYNVDDALRTLIREYRFDTVNLQTDRFIPSVFDALVMVKPTIPFTEDQKLKLDQYLMRGGKLFCMIDNLYDGFDSLYNKDGFIAYDRGLNMEDMLFRYGVRINQALLQDMQSDKLPQVSGQVGQQQQTRLVDWPIFPVLNGTKHPISKNIDGVRMMFPSTVDTVTAEGVDKTILLQSSANARVIPTPERVSFDFFQIAPDIKEFNKQYVPMAVLLEGKFRSLFANRLPRAMADTLARLYNTPFRAEAEPGAKLIVVGDGDLPMSQVSQTDGPLPMGMNLFTRVPYANKDFYENALDYLVNPSGILETRAKDYTLRLLDPKKVEEKKGMWQAINVAIPVLLVLVFALIYQRVRKGKYGKREA
ncbi:MAG: gliding motility-associated ABC transporter substrate-binding protein GldG [Chitinophagaceae bacterium]|nr:gliding motility-associated ABC transporter substrate-binding protein GldG [Chitinophagaceae bacterium]